MLDINAVFKAWQAGKIIANPEKWKSVGELTNACAGFLSAAVIVLNYWYPVIATVFPAEAQVVVAGGIASLIFGANIVINRVTTQKKIGLKTLKGK